MHSKEIMVASHAKGECILQLKSFVHHSEKVFCGLCLFSFVTRLGKATKYLEFASGFFPLCQYSNVFDFSAKIVRIDNKIYVCKDEECWSSEILSV